jgi:sugar phosphate isomerase/epimerase
MDAFLERLDPDVFLEMDIYWLQTSGADPVTTLAGLGGRVRRLHVMDGPCTMPVLGPEGLEGDPQTAVGSGTVDIAAALAAAPQVDWHVAEFGECAGDTFETVEASYRYLTQHGLSEGRI